MSNKKNVFTMFAVVAALSVSGLVWAQQKSKKAQTSNSSAQTSSATLGIISNQALQKSELDSGEQVKLYEAEKTYYNALEEILTQRYLAKYFETYQKDKKLPDVAAAQADFFKDRVKVSEEEVKKLLEENKDNPNLQKVPEAERANQVRQYLEGNAKSAAMRSFVEEEKRKGKIKVAMEQPIEPKLDVTDGGNPFLGPKDAKVTIVEFADYQCPFCTRMVPTLKDLMKKYEGKIRWVYRDFPLTEIHPEAIPAAVAASCAGRQNKYFEMHHRLFEDTKGLGEAFYKRIAKEIKLDEAKWEECRKDRAVIAEIMADQAEGTKLGVNGTPTYFVNGRKMGGGDVNSFSRVIDEELAKM